jgi:hypothetical protein
MQATQLRYLFLFLLTIASFRVSSAITPYTFYVSPSGNDNANGTSVNTPFASLEKARDAIRSLKQKHPLDAPVTVFLKGGTYKLKQTFTLSDRDSGTPDFPVTYAAYNNEKVILSGGQKISGWKPYKNGIWVAKLPIPAAGITYQFKQLYVNGSLRNLAKSPNSGFFLTKSSAETAKDAKEQPLNFFEYNNGDINPQWSDLTNAEVVVYHFWKDTHLPVQSVDAQKHIISFQYKSGKRFTDDKNLKLGARYIIQNVFEALDTAGEWYLNKKENQVYYYPLKGEDMQKVDVVAPVLPELLHIEGKAEKLRPASYLNFKSINFKYCGWNLQTGNINNRQGSGAVTGSITLKGAQNCVFESCTVQNISNFAFDILSGSSYNQIRNCELSYLGAGGIKMDGGIADDGPLLATGYNTITDNSLHHYGLVFPSAVGVFLFHTSNNLVSHNLIHDGYYTAISIGGVWGYLRSVAKYNVIEYNNIYNIGMGLLSDMGGIYTLGVSPGTVIRNNLIHDIRVHNYGGWGIYCDEGSAYILVENNIVYNTEYAPFNIHFGKELEVRNNIFCLGEKDQLSKGSTEPHKSMFFENNIVYWKQGLLFTYPWKDSKYMYHYTGKAKGEIEQTSTFDADRNIYYNPLITRDSVKLGDKSWQQWQQMGKDVHSLYTDPLFVNADAYNFNLKPGSPAFQLGFKAIDMSSVGPRKQ